MSSQGTVDKGPLSGAPALVIPRTDIRSQTQVLIDLREERKKSLLYTALTEGGVNLTGIMFTSSKDVGLMLLEKVQT